MKQSDFAGMTVNERLYLAGLLPRFDAATRAADRNALIDLLGQVDLADQAAAIADGVLSRSDPSVLRRTDTTPRRLNRARREIWFTRILGSYWPCHWKGVVLGPVTAVLVVPPALLLSWLFPSRDWVMAIPLVLGAIVALSLVVRHSE
jgi:hypothetical protein